MQLGDNPLAKIDCEAGNAAGAVDGRQRESDGDVIAGSYATTSACPTANAANRMRAASSSESLLDMVIVAIRCAAW